MRLYKKYSLVVYMLCFASVTFAQEVKLVTGDGYPPFVDSRHPKGGIASQIIVESLKSVGVEALIERRPWVRGYAETLNGNFVATFPYLKSESRERDFYYSSPLYKINQYYFYKKNKDLNLSEKQVLCNPIGWTLSNEMKEKVKSGLLRLEEPVDLYGCVRMVLAGRADFFIANRFILENIKVIAAIKEGLAKRLACSEPIYEYLIVSKKIKNTDFLKKFEFGLEKFKKSNEYLRLIDTISHDSNECL